ncbi:MAG: hypothetical protein JW937_09535 [Candidatus Omnitrophica bacterium]|nr:hypothetical protein [Candidatus Omnitrophota bacterium]
MKRLLLSCILCGIVSYSAVMSLASPERITVKDASGRDVSIPAQEYWDMVYAGPVKEARNDPAQLYTVLSDALQEGFVLEVERKIQEHLLAQGSSSDLLYLLAVLQSDTRREEEARQTLWQALQEDPNSLYALSWWGGIHYQEGGLEALAAAMEKAAGIEGAWRPQLWVARSFIEQGKLDPALALYREILPRAAQDTDALLMISGDLGKNGHAEQVLELLLNLYDPGTHSPLFGLNLARACLVTGQKEKGLEICETLEPQLSSEDPRLAELRKELNAL